MHEIYSKIKQNYLEGGILQVLNKSIKKMSYLLYHTNNAYWFRKDLRGGIENFDCDRDIYVDFDNPEETIEYIKNYGYYYPMEIMIGLKEGHLYTSLKYKDKIIGYNKTGYSKVYIEDFKKVYQFPDGIAYTYDIFIDPYYRNRGYGLFLLTEVCKHLRHKGFKSIWAHIPPWNKASEAMHQKLGFEKQKMISYFWIAGISFITINPVKFIQHIEKI